MYQTRGHRIIIPSVGAIAIVLKTAMPPEYPVQAGTQGRAVEPFSNLQFQEISMATEKVRFGVIGVEERCRLLRQALCHAGKRPALVNPKRYPMLIVAE